MYQTNLALWGLFFFLAGGGGGLFPLQGKLLFPYLMYSGSKGSWHLNMCITLKATLKTMTSHMLEHLTRLGPTGLVQFQTVFSFILMSVRLDAVWIYFTIVISQYFSLGTECKYLRFNMCCLSLSIRKYAMFPIFLLFEWVSTEGLPTGCLSDSNLTFQRCSYEDLIFICCEHLCQ